MTKFLYPLSLIYGVLVKADRSITRKKKLPRPVISVGNITWGGTGKTPTTIHLARELVARGLKPVVLSRGYYRKSGKSNPVIVSDGKNLLACPATAGDEPFMIAESAPGTAVVVGSSRYRSALHAMTHLSPDVFILDDGFQHWKLKRDLDIVCINALNPFGNGCLIPAGILREPVAALKRAGLVLVTNAGSVHRLRLESIETDVRRYNKEVPIIHGVYKTVYCRRVLDNRPVEIGRFRNREVVAVAGIGEKRGFHQLLEDNKIKIAERIDFRDHHWYNLREVSRIITCSPQSHPIITTTKDAVKLKDILQELTEQEAKRFFALEIEIDFLNGGEDWKREIQKALRSS